MYLLIPQNVRINKVDLSKTSARFCAQLIHVPFFQLVALLLPGRPSIFSRPAAINLQLILKYPDYN